MVVWFPVYRIGSTVFFLILLPACNTEKSYCERIIATGFASVYPALQTKWRLPYRVCGRGRRRYAGIQNNENCAWIRNSFLLQSLFNMGLASIFIITRLKAKTRSKPNINGHFTKKL